jgi:3-hydroxy-9,10-secoandrosta-1,3,5(10)-triene-9,17-dione monooxygenase reductase component
VVSAVTVPPPVASRTFRRVLGRFPTGVTIVTATTPAGPVGMAVNSFTSVSLDPPLVLFCAAHASTTWPHIRAAGAFTVNVLAAGHEALCRRFALRDVDRFAGVAHRPGTTGAPVLKGAAAHVDCHIDALHEAGDHVVVVGLVAHLAADDTADPLVFHGGAYRRLEA